MLFGSVGYMTTDPKNIEAVFSTRFDGTITAGKLIYVESGLIFRSLALQTLVSALVARVSSLSLEKVSSLRTGSHGSILENYFDATSYAYSIRI